MPPFGNNRGGNRPPHDTGRPMREPGRPMHREPPPTPDMAPPPPPPRRNPRPPEPPRPDYGRRQGGFGNPGGGRNGNMPPR